MTVGEGLISVSGRAGRNGIVGLPTTILCLPRPGHDGIGRGTTSNVESIATGGPIGAMVLKVKGMVQILHLTSVPTRGRDTGRGAPSVAAGSSSRILTCMIVDDFD